MKISALVLAAGEGTRMKSSIPKPLHKIAGYPMIDHVLNTISEVVDDVCVVIGPNMDVLRLHIEKRQNDIHIVVQENRKGTADAVKVGIENQQVDDLLVLFADTPFISTTTIKEMYKMLHEDHEKNAVVIAGFTMKTNNEYGRLVVDGNNVLNKIVEFRDSNEAEKKIELCNSGIMLINGKYVHDLLSEVKSENAKKEYYLTDIIGISHAKKLSCKYIKIDESEAAAVNSRVELANVEKIIQNQLRDKFINNGVTLIDRDSVYFSIDTKIENDVVIHQNVVVGPGVEIKSGTEIKSFSHIEHAKIGNDNTIGPFARIRPGTETGTKVCIGNFVEIKNSAIEENTKINHLSYIGDAYLGKRVNIGAGTITCNYDGYNKHITNIFDEAFIGSNVSLIAPVSIGNKSIIGAGSVIVTDVDDDDLAISRAEQKNFVNKASYIKRRKNYKNK